jgi:hypothetical protein
LMATATHCAFTLNLSIPRCILGVTYFEHLPEHIQSVYGLCSFVSLPILHFILSTPISCDDRDVSQVKNQL